MASAGPKPSLLIPLSLLACACHPAAQKAEEARVDTSAAESVTVTVPVYTPTGLSAAARIEGRLAMRGLCRGIETGGGGFAVPAFPEGSASWDGQALTFKGRRTRLGEAIELGGGFRGTDGPEVRGLAPECAGSVWMAG